MRVLVLGKIGNITHWVEDAVAGFRAGGHDVWVGVTRNPAWSRPIERALVSPALGSLRARRILSAVRRLRPDFILVIMPYLVPSAIIERVAAMPGRPPMFGWVGDVFSETDRPIADALDLVAYTDTALIARHRVLGFRAPTLFLPHAATPRSFDHIPSPSDRRDRMVFVASVTPRRHALVSSLTEPIALYGPGWRPDRRELISRGHHVEARRVTDSELARIYPAYRVVLNIANEENVLAGLNQRNFTPYLSATPVLTDAQPDIERCFEPGREVLVFHNAEEMNDYYAKLRRHPEIAEQVGHRGNMRVLAEHSYLHRLAALSAKL